MTDNQNSGGEAVNEAIARGTEVFEKAEERIRDLNEQIIESARKSGEVSLDAYEKALQSVLEYETKAAEATQLDFINSVTKAHVNFVTDMSKVFTDAARSVMK